MIGLGKTVLIIGDEALYVYSAGKDTRLVDAVPWGVEGFQEQVKKIITKDCGGKSIVILNDMVEQHYRKERIPKVGLMDKANVVKRKLAVSFPNYPIRAALPLKEKVGSANKKLSANMYVFAAAPSTPAFQQTMAVANKSLVSLSGLGLLPIEASSMVNALSSKLRSKTDKKPLWNVFIGQHKSGNLRQIVVKNGELALTRMTPIVNTDVDIDRWCHEIYQEFQSTLSYMARFGFSKEDGLDVAIIAENEAGSTLESVMEDVDGKIYALTVSDAASKLGLSVSPQSEQQYADVLHAAWVGKKAKLALPMQAKAVDQISRPRQIAMLASGLMVLGLGYVLYETYNNYSVLTVKNEKLAEIDLQQRQLDIEYDKEVEKKKATNIDVNLLKAAVGIHGDIEKDDIKSLKLFKSIGKAVGQDLRLDEINIRKSGEDILEAATNTINNFTQNANKDDYVYEAILKMSYPSTTNVDKGNEEVKVLAQKLRALLPDHHITIEKFLKDTSYTDEVIIGEQTEDKVQQDFVASISIKGSNS